MLCDGSRSTAEGGLDVAASGLGGALAILAVVLALPLPLVLVLVLWAQ